MYFYAFSILSHASLNLSDFSDCSFQQLSWRSQDCKIRTTIKDTGQNQGGG